jgi:hypothetical protein
VFGFKVPKEFKRALNLFKNSVGIEKSAEFYAVFKSIKMSYNFPKGISQSFN